MTAPPPSAPLALLAGAGSRHGRVVALSLAEAGVEIALAAATRATEQSFAVNSIANELWAIGRRHVVLSMDFHEPPSVAEAIAQILAEFGRIDVLVNAAEEAVSQPFAETPESAWQRALDRNFGGARLTCHAAGKAMLERSGGRIINIVSTAAVRGGAGAAPLAAAQAGVLGLTRSLAAEWGGRIAVNAVVAGDTTPPQALGSLITLLASTPIELTGQVFEL